MKYWKGTKSICGHVRKNPSSQSTLSWKALGESLRITAVVVNHVLPLHPSHPSVAHRVQLMGVPRILNRWSTRGHHVLRRATRGTIRPHASIGIEVPVVRGEGRMSPVSLDEPPHCGPVIGIPQAGVQSHRLVLGERYPTRLVILEISNRNVIDQQPWKREESESLDKLGMDRQLAS